MADQAEILTVLNASYALRFDRLEFLRDGGSMAYAAYANGHKFFLRVTKPAFYDTVLPSTDIHVYLLERGFPVPPIVFTRGNLPYVQVNGGGGKHFYILYEYIEGREADASLDAEQAGALAGRLHGTYSLFALYHFTLQATMIELYGPDCVDNGFFDKQLDWLLRWRTQCGLYFQLNSEDSPTSTGGGRNRQKQD